MIRKVLVVDDEKTSRTLVVRVIEKMGAAAFQAADGRMALDLLELNPDIALVVTDMVMPGLDGRALIQHMLKKKSLAQIPVVIMSGEVGVKDISDLLKEGAKAFLRKPLRAEEVREYAGRYLTATP